MKFSRRLPIIAQHFRRRQRRMTNLLQQISNGLSK
jgi:hypothetical protein